MKHGKNHSQIGILGEGEGEAGNQGNRGEGAVDEADIGIFLFNASFAFQASNPFSLILTSWSWTDNNLHERFINDIALPSFSISCCAN